MNGRRKIICLGKVGLLTFALLGGVICSVNVHQNHTNIAEKCEIITLSQRKVNQAEVNIEAGVHILMGYARRAESISKALAFYNAGPSRWRLGRGYARAVLKLYLEMEG